MAHPAAVARAMPCTGEGPWCVVAATAATGVAANARAPIDPTIAMLRDLTVSSFGDARLVRRRDWIDDDQPEGATQERGKGPCSTALPRRFHPARVCTPAPTPATLSRVIASGSSGYRHNELSAGRLRRWHPSAVRNASVGSVVTGSRNAGSVRMSFGGRGATLGIDQLLFVGSEEGESCRQRSHRRSARTQSGWRAILAAAVIRENLRTVDKPGPRHPAPAPYTLRIRWAFWRPGPSASGGGSGMSVSVGHVRWLSNGLTG